MNCDNSISIKYDVVVIGGGMAGICAAISAAREGMKTALVQDRPVLGGNASSEIRMHICGASRHGERKNLRETGIIEEILLENKYRNPEHSYALFDALLWEKVTNEKNIDLYLNTYAQKVNKQNNSISEVVAVQTTTEKLFVFSAKQFIDCSGDGLISYLAGADFMFGREAKSQFNEPNAVETADTVTMGNSIQFRALSADRPVPFKRPEWAYDYSKEKWAANIKWAEITSGYWWLEVGGTEWNCIKDAELTRDEMLKIIFGIWDYIKNFSNCKEKAQNLYLDWVSFVPAKRESRRIVGDYVLNENDVIENRMFYDVVAYGGWHLDSHRPEGFYAFVNNEPQLTDKTVRFDGIYTIPYRCIYAKGIDNLLLGGRIISASHRAFSSTRVMATCAVLGEAAGVAAAIAVCKNINAPAVSQHIDELQQTLLKNGCYIPNIKNKDENDLALSAEVSADNYINGFEPQNVINGISRPVGNCSNMWKSEGVGKSLTLKLKAKHKIGKVMLTFDSDLSKEIMISLSNWHKVRQDYSVPDSIVKDYKVEFLSDGEVVGTSIVTENHQRNNTVFCNTVCDAVKITVISTNGSKYSSICEVRIY